MEKFKVDCKNFALCMSQKVKRIADRAVAFLYYYAVEDNKGVSIQQLLSDFNSAGLGMPNITKLRKALSGDRRTVKISKDEWRLKSDKIAEVEKNYQLNQCLKKSPLNNNVPSGSYVHKERFENLKKIKSEFDLSRLVQMLSEVDNAFAASNYITVILLMRAILDHIPPIFKFKTFTELTNNYGGTKSFKESMLNLENSSRKIADAYLHTTIRKKETLPNDKQVNFSNDLDVLLAEIIRISPQS